MTQKQRLTWALALLFAVSIAVISLAQQTETATYQQGSSGGQVRIIQTRLKSQGCYDGAVDGICDNQTAQTVKYFQRKNGLAADGIVGPAILKTLGISSKDGGSSSQQNSAALLARVISAEARGEPYSGQVVVGAVILSRVEHPSFPNTITGMVYQPGAFICMVGRQLNKPVADSAYRAAQDALSGADPSDGAICYFSPDTATSAWIWNRPLTKAIGKHRFCA